MAKDVPRAVELDELTRLYFPRTERLGQFEERLGEQCPVEYRRMLDHESHMTVTVERRHGCAVDVEVLDSQLDEVHYTRKILLRRQDDQRVVQFGIVRLALAALQPPVRDEIMAQKIPLGRVLIKHDVLRQVQLNALWRVECGPELAGHFAVPAGSVTFGRTALIYCDGEPAVELLEIVAPEDSF